MLLIWTFWSVCAEGRQGVSTPSANWVSLRGVGVLPPVSPSCWYRDCCKSTRLQPVDRGESARWLAADMMVPADGKCWASSARRSMQSELYVMVAVKTFSLFSLDGHRRQDFSLCCGKFPRWAARHQIVCYCVLASFVLLHRSVVFSLSRFPNCSPPLCHSLSCLCGIKPNLHHYWVHKMCRMASVRRHHSSLGFMGRVALNTQQKTIWLKMFKNLCKDG